MSVSQDQAVKDLLDFATNNTETQGKFTIGDEKVCIVYLVSFEILTSQKHNLFMRINVCSRKPPLFLAKLKQEKSIQDAVKESTPLGTMAKLRELKNKF